MTRDEFIAAFKAEVKPSTWVLTSVLDHECRELPSLRNREFFITTETPMQCPLTALATTRGLGSYQVHEYPRAAHQLKIEPEDADLIAAAADGRGVGFDPALRAALLDACGLTEAPSA